MKPGDEVGYLYAGNLQRITSYLRPFTCSTQNHIHIHIQNNASWQRSAVSQPPRFRLLTTWHQAPNYSCVADPDTSSSS